MGSVCSFPFLCILSLTAALYSKGDVWIQGFLKKSPSNAFKALSRIRDIGINGDDVLLCTRKAKGHTLWEEGVRAIGGVVSRGKTLVNKRYFTINSELWSRDGQVKVIRPSLITALTGNNQYFISPQREWKEYRDANIHGPFSSIARHIWQIEKKLKLDLPISLGGLGIVINPEIDPDYLLEHFVEVQYLKQFKCRIGTAEYFQEEDDREKTDVPKIDVWISREMYKAYQARFTTKKGFWDASKWEVEELLKYAQFGVPNQKDPEKASRIQEKARFLVSRWYERERGRTFFSRREILDRLRGTRVHTNLLSFYKKMMLGYRIMKLPVDRISTYQAQPLDIEDIEYLREVEKISNFSL